MEEAGGEAGRARVGYGVVMARGGAYAVGRASPRIIDGSTGPSDWTVDATLTVGDAPAEENISNDA